MIGRVLYDITKVLKSFEQSCHRTLLELGMNTDFTDPQFAEGRKKFNNGKRTDNGLNKFAVSGIFNHSSTNSPTLLDLYRQFRNTELSVCKKYITREYRKCQNNPQIHKMLHITYSSIL